jgi:hypothetical protein
VKRGQAVRSGGLRGGYRDGGRGGHRDGLAYDSRTPPPPPGKSVQSLRSRSFAGGRRVWDSWAMELAKVSFCFLRGFVGVISVKLGYFLAEEFREDYWKSRNCC